MGSDGVEDGKLLMREGIKLSYEKLLIGIYLYGFWIFGK
jgi:hypothetical protein